VKIDVVKIIELLPYAVTVIGLLVGWLRERKLLPVKVQKVIDRLPWRDWKSLIFSASELVGKSPLQRREWLVEQVLRRIRAAEEDEGIPTERMIPEGFIRLACEWAYQKISKGRF
jgi:hypothetical protein